MTEPTRDALHARTLTWLESGERYAIIPSGDVSLLDVCAMYAHAAACVRRVPELEAEVEEFRKQTAFYRVQAEEFWAEVERLRAKAAIVDAMERALAHAKTCETCFRYGVDECVTGSAYAAATREGTDATK